MEDVIQNTISLLTFCSGPFCNIVYLARSSLSRVSLLRNIMHSVTTPYLSHEGCEVGFSDKFTQVYISIPSTLQLST